MANKIYQICTDCSIFPDPKTCTRMDMPVKNLVSGIDLKPNDAFLPLFEIVVNAILSLKLSTNLKREDKKIQIQILRSENPIGPLHDYHPIQSIKVYDNGEGFNDKNFDSFKTAYSNKNKELGCKGIGRFTVLAAFESIHVKSNYYENDKWNFREFSLDQLNEIKPLDLKPSENEHLQTEVEMKNCYNLVVTNNSCISVHDIGDLLMHHCLVYYLCGDFPRVEIIDKTNEEVAVVNEMYQAVSKDREKDFNIKAHDFKYYITKTLKTSNRKHHYIYYCANSRVVGNPKYISSVNNLFAYPIIEDGYPFFLDVYVVSDYLNKKVYSSRNGFSIPQEPEVNLFSDYGSELSFIEIDTAIAKELEAEYDEFVKSTHDRNINEIKGYIINNAPRYKRFLSRPEVLNSIPPNLSDDKKEEFLYKASFNEKKQIDNKIQRFIQNKNVNDETIEEIKEELKQKTAFDGDSLADYMARRKAIMEIFDKFLDADQNGSYKLESDIHNLIFPMGITSHQIDYESHNLWLLDERFSTYSFIASDKPITSVSQVSSRREPDMLMLDNPPMFDNPISFGSASAGQVSSMVIFEFKRPGEVAHQKGKADFRWSFSELVEKYFDDFLYSDTKKNYKGNQVVIEKTTPKFGYVVVDVIPPKLKEYNLGKGFKPTPFGTLFKIEPELNLHIEVITFRQLIDAVENRHAPFFDKLFTLETVK